MGREWLADSSAFGASVIGFVMRSYRVSGVRATRAVIIWADRRLKRLFGVVFSDSGSRSFEAPPNEWALYLKFSNSMIEAWWRSLKHQWLFLHPLDSVTTVRRFVEFYVHGHNSVLPHSAFRGQTPDEMSFGTGDAVPADLTERAAAARQARVEANRSAFCETCPSLNAAA